MPQAIRYTAKRELINTLDALVTFDLDVTRKDASRKATTRLAQALSGRRVTTYYAGKRTWRVQTKILTGNDALTIREFLASVEDGQQFSFAPDNYSADSPITWVSCYIDGAQRAPRRVSLGGTQSNDYFQFSFTIIEA